MAPWLEAPKGRESKAQGNALGNGCAKFIALKGRHRRGIAPFQGLGFPANISQSVALACQIFAPSGLSVTGGYPLKAATNQF